MKINILNVKKSVILAAFSIFAVSAFGLPSKRGICYNSLNPAELSSLKGGATWGYNWAGADESEGIGTADFAFCPMIWGGGKDFEDMFQNAETYLAAHPETEYLLGFNEPMMKNAYGGCDMTSSEAAELWIRLEDLAKKYGVKLASPALTWGFEPLTGDGKVYGAPEEWMNAWIEEFKKLHGREPYFDCVALHSYMDYAAAVVWFCEYYSDYFKKPVLLTEFCAWSNEENQTPHKSLAGQIDSMTQKLEALDVNEKVLGYAWFMSHAETKKVPFNSIFTEKGGKGKLTELGTIYVNMSSSDKSVWFKTGELIPAYKYVSSSNYNEEAGEKPDDASRFATPISIRINSDKKTAKEIPLEVGGFTNERYADYQIEVTESRNYTLKLRYKSDAEQYFHVNANGTEVLNDVLKKSSKWKEVSFVIPLESGKQIIRLKSLGFAKDLKISAFELQ